MIDSLIKPVLELVRAAGQATLPYWQAGVAVQTKADDSPVTAADIAAHKVLAAGLAALDASIPVLSEEDCAIALSERQQWTRWWLVDPLDGTKEFISGSAEYTVNVALVERGEVVSVWLVCQLLTVFIMVAQHSVLFAAMLTALFVPCRCALHPKMSWWYWPVSVIAVLSKRRYCRV